MSEFWKYVESKSIPVPFSGCLIWLGAYRGKYGVVYDNVRKKQISTHRLSYEIHKGPILPGMLVCHTCDVTDCLNPSHLFLGTVQDNSDDMVMKGRQAKGRPFYRKLSDEQVLSILDDPRPYRLISEEFQVTSATISSIKTGAQWSMVTGKVYDPKKKVTCRQGHPWVEKNVGFNKKKNSRYCLLCNRERMARYRLWKCH